jgi:hypothetical protein
LLVSSGKTGKIGKSRTQPVQSSSMTNGIVIAPSPSITGVSSRHQATTAAPATSNRTSSGTTRPTSSAGSHRSATSASRASPSYSSRPRASIRSSSRGTSRGRYSPARQKRD